MIGGNTNLGLLVETKTGFLTRILIFFSDSEMRNTCPS